MMAAVLEGLEASLWSLGFMVLAAFIGLVAHFILFQILQRIIQRRVPRVSAPLIQCLKAPLRVLIPLLAVRISLPAHALNLPPEAMDYLGTLLSVTLIIVAAWLLIRVVKALQDIVLSRYDINASDNLAARKMATQMDIVRKIIVFVIVVFAVAAALMNFENFRQVGAGMLASAGLAGLILGFAAQTTISNLLAGFQIALTQPIRIDDVVIVEGEWGRIEEVTLTYVVVAIWDMRRLVLPISYFIEKPFQNWTRSAAKILGTVFIYTDYTVPIEEVRQYLGEALKESEFWDGEVWRLHVTDSGERTLQLRALMSAANSGDAWELRCEIREKLVGYIQKNYPDALPKLRTEIGEFGSIKGSK